MSFGAVFKTFILRFCKLTEINLVLFSSLSLQKVKIIKSEIDFEKVTKLCFTIVYWRIKISTKCFECVILTYSNEYVTVFKMTLSIQCVTLSEYVMVLNVSSWANVSLWNDIFTESDKFRSCFFIICQEILISQNVESVTTFFLKVSLLTNVSLLNVSLLTNVSKKTNVSLKSDWFIWKCHFLWHIHSKVTHSKPVENRAWNGFLKNWTCKVFLTI